MRWQSHVAAVEYLPRARRRRGWAGFALLAIMAGLAWWAGPAAALLLRAATILLSVAVVAGIIAYAALRIGVAPWLGPRRRRPPVTN